MCALTAASLFALKDIAGGSLSLYLECIAAYSCISARLQDIVDAVPRFVVAAFLIDTGLDLPRG